MQTIEIESSSRKGLTHKVVDYDTFMECDCEAFHFRKYCSHIKKALKIINTNYEQTRTSSGEVIRSKKNEGTNVKNGKIEVGELFSGRFEKA